MSGIAIVGALLLDDAALTAIVPPTRIDAWMLPQGTPNPSIVLTRISRVQHQFLTRQQTRLITERVQVTVRANDGEQRGRVLGLAETAAGDRFGTIAGFAQASVLYAGGGPDFMDDAASIFMGSLDLRVSFTEPA